MYKNLKHDKIYIIHRLNANNIIGINKLKV